MGTEPLPLVTVIIPVYLGTYLEETLRSVMEQDWPRMEVIVVNDGSPDPVEGIVKKFPGVRLTGGENRGVASARNRGLRQASGELIAFIDADDTWIPEKTRLQAEFLGGNRDTDLVYGRFENYFQEGAVPPPEVSRERFLAPDTGKMISLGTLMAWARVFRSTGLFNESLRRGEDLDWFVRLREKGIAVSFDDRVVMRRRLHDRNLTYESLGGKTDLARILRESIRRRRGEG